MSNIAAGGIKLNGLNAGQTTSAPDSSQNVQLRGINWNTQATNTGNQPVNTNWNNDAAVVTRPNYGNVPANDDLPALFTPETSQNTSPGAKVKSATVSDPNAKKDGGMVTGIGMAVGAVAGGFIGSKIAPGVGGMGIGAKLGIGLGLIVGGFFGNRYEK